MYLIWQQGETVKSSADTELFSLFSFQHALLDVQAGLLQILATSHFQLEAERGICPLPCDEKLTLGICLIIIIAGVRLAR